MKEKEIIVGIDFSKGSLNALKFAVTLAKHLGSNLTMVWVDKPQNPESVYDNGAGTYRKEVHRRFDELIEEYSSELKGLKLQYKIRAGKVYEEIAYHAKYNDASYVISGTHGISGFEELWIGSNANRIVSVSPCPVVTIRQGYAVKNALKRIVLPIDSTPETRQKAAYALEIAKAFNSEVHLVGMYVSKVSTLRKRVDNYMSQLLEYFNKGGVHVVNTSIEANNLTSDLLGYAEKVNADLLVIMTEQETSTANILLGPYAQQLVNHSPIPVLSIHPKNLFK